MNIQTIIKSMRGQAKTADQLRQALDQIDIEALEAAEERLEAERRLVLLVGSDKELDAIEAKIATANRDIERAYAAKVEFTKRLDEAAAAATEAELTERYSSAKAKADAAAKMLKEYATIGRRFVDLIRAIAEADIAVDEANVRRQQQLILRAQMLKAGLDPETIERELNDFKREVLARIPSSVSLPPRRYSMIIKTIASPDPGRQGHDARGNRCRAAGGRAGSERGRSKVGAASAIQDFPKP